MLRALPTTAATTRLTLADQRRLIADAQDVELVVDVDADGAEVTRYGTTPAAEAALDRLTTSFLPLMVKVARTARALDYDDALGVVAEEFISAVRRYDLEDDVPFHATITSALRYALSDASRASDVVVVKGDVHARYWRLMHKHDGDVGAAYDECRTTSNNFAPATFLAVHHALSALSMDWNPNVDGQNTSHGSTVTHSVHGGTPSDLGHMHLHNMVGAEPDPYDPFLTADFVRALFSEVTERQESILRALYGFEDAATTSLTLAAGFRPGDVLSDLEAGAVLGITRPTVQRERVRALGVMRAAAQSWADEEAGK